MAEEFKKARNPVRLDLDQTPMPESELPKWYDKPPRAPSFFQRVGESLSRAFRKAEPRAIDLAQVPHKVVARGWVVGPGIPKEPKFRD
jgi:hypothetical protein